MGVACILKFGIVTHRVLASVAELVDALDLGSSSIRSVGSSPTSRILTA